MSPAVYCLARRIRRAVSATVSLRAPIPGGQGCPGRAGTGASPSGMPRSASSAWPPSSRRPSSCPLQSSGASSWLPAAGAGERVMSPHSPLRMATSRSWARAARAVCRQIASQGAHLGLVPAEHVLSGLERFLAGPAPPGDPHEGRHRGRLVFRSPAQVKRQVARPGDQAADQQDVPRAGGGGQCPVREPGSLGPVPARAALEDRVLHRVRGLDHRARRQGDAEAPRDDRHVRQARGLARPAQGAAAPVHFVEGCPPGRQASLQQALRWPAAAWSCVPARGGCPRPGAAPGPSPTARAGRRRSPPTPARMWSRTRRTRSSGSFPRARCTRHAAAPRTRSRPRPSAARSHRSRSPGRSGRPPRTAATPGPGRAAPRAASPSPSGSCAAAPASGTGCDARPPRPGTSSSPSPPAPAPPRRTSPSQRCGAAPGPGPVPP